MENTKFLQPEGDERTESFSFSCLSNSAMVFTDDGGSSSDESFFEIALESGSARKSKSDHPQNRENEKEMELLRISFSSSFPLPELVTNGPLINDRFERSTSSFESVTFVSFPSTSTTSRSQSTRSTADAKFWRAPPLGRSSSSFNKTLKRRLKFPNTENSVEDQGNSDGSFGDAFKAQIQRNQEEFVKGRNMSNITNKGGMMKIFRKSKKFGGILASLMKPRKLTSSDQVNVTGRIKKRSEEKLQRNSSQITPWDKSPVQMEQGKNRGFKMNLESIRGVVSFGRNERRRTMSCPSSIKSSPIHSEYSSESKMMCVRDSSIQAAIAHCKISLGQNADFRY